MKKIYFILIFIILVFSSSSKVYCDSLSNDNEISAYFDSEMNNTDYSIAKAKIISIDYNDTMEKRYVTLESDIRYQHIKVKILNAKFKGQTLVLKHTVERIMPRYYIFKNGDKILLRITDKEGSKNRVESNRYTGIHYNRYIYYFIINFWKIKGFKNFIFTFFNIIFAYTPLILKGYSPIISSIAISIIAIILTLIIISKFNKKNLAAVIGTSTCVIMAGILAIIFEKVAHLTGLSDDSSISLAYIPQFRNLNYQGILFGTMLIGAIWAIGAIGAIMYVAISK